MIWTRSGAVAAKIIVNFALALVVFATWRPSRLALGALLFGGVSALGWYLQAVGVHVSTFALGSLPYLPGELTPVWELLADRIQ